VLYSGTLHYLFYSLLNKLGSDDLFLQFYYGDINLGRDKFLQEQIKLDDGCRFSAHFINFCAEWLQIFLVYNSSLEIC
jgi:hypothetical protein